MDENRKNDYEKARQFILNNVKISITHELIKNIHHLVKPDDKYDYRPITDGMPHIFNDGIIIYYGASGNECDAEMKKKLNNFINSSLSLETIIKFHWYFVKIHPFNDGNGRTARLLMSLMLLKIDYSDEECTKIENYLDINKKNYYDALNDGKRTYVKDGKVSEKFFEYIQNIIKKAR